MPEGPDGKTIIIVKKVSGHGGHHGGAWKVAYADFVTAMMALFMVLWLVNSASVTTRERIASYFREPGVFEKGSGTPLEEGGAGILSDAFSPPADENSRAVHSKKIYRVEASLGKHPDAFDIGEGVGEGKEAARPVDKSDIEQLVNEIKQELKEAAAKNPGDDGKLIGNIEVKVDQRGLHIEIMDTEKASMFELGSSRMNELAEQELGKIASLLSSLPNPIDIEGHTDGRPFKGAGKDVYDNWNLSSDRANAARRVLLRNGIKEKQVARVAGYADQRLKYPEDPLASGNRRISISMRFTELAAKTLEGTKTQVTEARPVAPVNPKQPAPEKQPQASGKPAIPPNPSQPVQAPANQAPSNQASASQPLAQTQETKHGLSVEVGVTAPEGTPITSTGDDSGETWMDKDKIFGNKNPFFGE